MHAQLAAIRHRMHRGDPLDAILARDVHVRHSADGGGIDVGAHSHAVIFMKHPGELRRGHASIGDTEDDDVGFDRSAQQLDTGDIAESLGQQLRVLVIEANKLWRSRADSVNAGRGLTRLIFEATLTRTRSRL